MYFDLLRTKLYTVYPVCRTSIIGTAGINSVSASQLRSGKEIFGSVAVLIATT